MQILSPVYWKDYELIDTGGFEKLERFGDYILARPEPQACWQKSMSEEEWKNLAHVCFVREKSGSDNENEKGRWKFLKKMPDQWCVSYQYKTMKLQFRLGLTAFKHVGLFPEQAENWNFIFDRLSGINKGSCKVLNLFAYTGGASLAARAAGAEVIHVDSVKPVVSWARENMEASGLMDIRWVVEDAVKFVKREVRRGNKYQGIILDPPAYGRGPDGEKWVLEEGIAGLLGDCACLFESENPFMVLNLYSMGFSSLVAHNLMKGLFPESHEMSFGELYFNDRSGNRLPLGIFCRTSY